LCAYATEKGAGGQGLGAIGPSRGVRAEPDLKAPRSYFAKQRFTERDVSPCFQASESRVSSGARPFGKDSLQQTPLADKLLDDVSNLEILFFTSDTQY
jgi:hypothetical protein